MVTSKAPCLQRPFCSAFLGHSQLAHWEMGTKPEGTKGGTLSFVAPHSRQKCVPGIADSPSHRDPLGSSLWSPEDGIQGIWDPDRKKRHATFAVTNSELKWGIPFHDEC